MPIVSLAVLLLKHGGVEQLYQQVFTTSSCDLPSVRTTAMRFLTLLLLCDEGKTWSTENLMALPVCETVTSQMSQVFIRAQKTAETHLGVAAHVLDASDGLQKVRHTLVLP